MDSENWIRLLFLFVGAFLVFVANVIRTKLFEKKVNLVYELDKPSVFSITSPGECFQNLRIWNKGNITARKVRVNLKADHILSHDIKYRAIKEEGYSKEETAEVLSLEFEKLLPKEELIISFKSNAPLPNDFYLSVKSDEMIARPISQQEKRNRIESIINVIVMVVVGVMGGAGVVTYISHNTPVVPTATVIQASPMINLRTDKAMTINLITDKAIYTRGEKIELTGRVHNTDDKTLTDEVCTLTIPGIDLEYENIYQKKSFLAGGEQVEFKRSINIPKKMPNGKYKISLSCRAYGLDTAFKEESAIYFEVR